MLCLDLPLPDQQLLEVLRHQHLRQSRCVRNYQLGFHVVAPAWRSATYS